MAQYLGSMKNNLFWGRGELTFSNGDKYSGSFQNGLFDGMGKYVLGQNRFIYNGQFKEGVFNGKGSLKLVNEYIL